MREERTTRICSKCGAEKRTDEFPMKSGDKTVAGTRKYRSHVCRTCHNVQQREWFTQHPYVRPAANRAYWDKSDPRYPARLARVKQQRANRKALNYAFMDAERVRGCIDCGERDWRVLQFDHVRGKTANLAVMSGSSTVVFLRELDRCDVVCANCHARRGYERRRKQPLDSSA